MSPRYGPRTGERWLREDVTTLARLFVATGRRLARPPSGLASTVAGSVALVIALAYAWKRPIAAFVDGRGGGLALRLAEVANVGGAGATMTLFGLAALVVGRALRRDALVNAALVLGAAGAWCWILTRTGQIVLAEQRPVEGGEMRWFAMDGHGVSGHAAIAALLFAPVRDVLARRAPGSVRHAAAGAIMAWAAFVGWSRMWLGMHFLWNVVLGLALGFLTGHAAVAAWTEVDPEFRTRG